VTLRVECVGVKVASPKQAGRELVNRDIVWMSIIGAAGNRE
jgi:hypothetical protein